VNGLKKVSVGVHVSSYEELNNTGFNNKPCNALLKRGPRKGQECGKNCQLGYDKCKAHGSNANELILFSK
jgi:hypothetical protein